MAEVFLGEDEAKAKAYGAKEGLKHILLPDPRQLSRAKYKYPVNDMPLHVLVGKNGVIVATGRAVPSAAEIEEALK
ncbi:MAG: hypothetical protein HYY18_12245 [Planctomycetes bacterium]|nr:hypothetical protein [Planctomycetota bacterium]